MPDVVFITTRIRMSEAAAERYLASTKGRAPDWSDWVKVYELMQLTPGPAAEDFREENVSVADAIKTLERSGTKYEKGALQILVETNTDDLERSPWTLALVRHAADFKDRDGTDTILVHTDPDGRDAPYEALRVVFRATQGATTVQPSSSVPRREWKSLNLGFDFIQKIAFGEDVLEDDDDDDIAGARRSQ